MWSASYVFFCLSVCGLMLACVVEQLERADFFSESIPKSRLFVTVHDAVLHILHKMGHAEFALVSSSIYISVEIPSSLSFAHHLPWLKYISKCFQDMSCDTQM